MATATATAADLCSNLTATNGITSTNAANCLGGIYTGTVGTPGTVTCQYCAATYILTPTGTCVL